MVLQSSRCIWSNIILRRNDIGACYRRHLVHVQSTPSWVATGMRYQHTQPITWSLPTSRHCTWKTTPISTFPVRPFPHVGFSPYRSEWWAEECWVAESLCKKLQALGREPNTVTTISWARTQYMEPRAFLGARRVSGGDISFKGVSPISIALK